MSRGTLRLVFLAAGLFSMAWFWLFGPWLVASRPIEEIYAHELSNLPPPDYARSFAINHGAAIYFRDEVPSLHPVKSGLLMLPFGVSMFTALWAYDRLRRSRRHVA